jgi:maleylpyruvate isomerase
MTMTYSESVSAVARSQARFEATLATLTDEQARELSALPGWTRGHVATHLCRNADALNRLAVGVLTAAPGVMYPGGTEARDAAIEEGADRPAALLAADAHFAGMRAVDSLRRLDELSRDNDGLLDTPLAWRRPVTARDLPVMRWNELEIHHLDLAAGYTAQDWPADFVTEALAAQLPLLSAAAPDLPVPDLPPAELLAWLFGRPPRAGLPAPPPWPF